MDLEGRNDRPRPRRAAASMPTSSSDPQKQYRVKTKPATKNKGKRIPTKKPVTEERWWTIKDIIEEKLEKGVVYYRVEWDGTDDKGQPYDSSWVAEREVTEAAVTSWKRKKNKAANTSPQDTNAPRPEPDDSTEQQSSQDDELVQLANFAHKKCGRQTKTNEGAVREEEIAEKAKAAPKPQKLTAPHSRQAAGQTTQEGLGAVSDSSAIGKSAENRKGREESGQRVGGIVVELPQESPSKWLEFQRLPSSQTSQSSLQQPQQSQTGWSQTQSAQNEISPQNRDRRVIPDSQEISGISTSDTQNSLPQPTQLTNSRISQEGATQTQLSEERSSRTDIPSHQPDQPEQGLLNNQDQLITAETDPGSSQRSLAYRFPDRNSSQNTTGSGDYPAFQSQLSLGSIPQATSQPSINNNVKDTSTEIYPTQKSLSAADSTFSRTNSQAAQIVPQLNSHSQATFEFYQGTVIPYTGEDQQSQQALRGSDGNTNNSSSALGESRATPGGSQSPIPASVPSVTAPVQQSNQSGHPGSPTTTSNMQNSPSYTPGKAAETLRLIRERQMAAFLLSRSSNAPTNLDTSSPSPGQSESAVPVEASSHAETVPGLSVIVPQPNLPMMPLEVSPELVQAEQPPGVSTTQISPEPPQIDNLPLVMAPAALSFNTSHDEPPTTLDPSHLTLSIEERDLSPSIPTDDALAESAGPEDFIPPGDFSKQTDDELTQQYSKGLLPYIPIGVNEHLITLPFFATTFGRETYNEIIHENQAAITAYTSCFLEFPYQKPDPSVITAIDKLFSRLFDFCDFPPFLETAVELGPEVLTKHVVGINPKFCFVDEFLLRLNKMGSVKKILILVRPGQLPDLLSNVVQTRGYHLIRSGQESTNLVAAQSLTVAIHTTNEPSSSLPNDADAIIAFDHTYRQDLLPPSDEANPPLVLLLTTTNSIQHINMRIAENMEPLERKNYLMRVLIKAMRHIEEPDFTLRKPDEIAGTFAHYLEEPDDDAFYWEPQDFPEDLFDNIQEGSSSIQQSQHTFEPFSYTQAPGSRKRSHEVIEESASKRPKMSQAQVVSGDIHISDSVRDLVGHDIISNPGTATVNVSVEKLESLSTKVSRLTAQLEESRRREEEFRQLSDRSKKEVDGYTVSINKIQTKFMEALRDRGIFEAECNEAKEQAETLTSSLQSARKEIATLKDTNTEFRSKLSEATESLLHSAVPELAKMAQLEKDLEESRAVTQRLEKRLTLAQGDHEYTKTAYQQASQSAAQLRTENGELESRIEDLERRAGDNVVRIHELQNRQEVAELARLLAEQRALVRDRELELNRLRDEIRSLRNSRRETRQSSVPRSPRLSAAALGAVLSPRTHIPTTPSARGAASSSRAASPASVSGVGVGGVQYDRQQQQQQPPPPPMGVFEPQFLGRHSHLRD